MLKSTFELKIKLFVFIQLIFLCLSQSHTTEGEKEEVKEDTSPTGSKLHFNKFKCDPGVIITRKVRKS